MKQPKEPLPIKLVFGLLYTCEKAYQQALEHLQCSYGPIDLYSETVAYTASQYYQQEMGQGIKRQFISFERLVPRSDLVQNKLDSIELETKLARLENDKILRLINLDPGHLAAEKFVLATTKNYPHRIYLHSGIFADLTLMCKGKELAGLQWTYPDYLTEPATSFFADARQIYLKSLKK